VLYQNGRVAPSKRTVLAPSELQAVVLPLVIPAGVNTVWGAFFSSIEADASGALGGSLGNWVVTRDDAGVLVNPVALGGGLLQNLGLVITGDDTVEMRADNPSAVDQLEVVLQTTRMFLAMQSVVVP